MKAITVFACAGMLCLTGCMNTYDLTRPVPELSPDQVNEKLLGNTWTIERLDGASVKGKVIAASRDSILFVEEFTGQPGSMSRRDIATISSSPGVVGPVVGLLGGALLGGLLGGAIGAVSVEPHNTAEVIYQPVINSMQGAEIGVLIGAPVGLAIGGVISAGARFTFNEWGTGRNAGLDSTIVIDREDFTGETTSSITFRWQGKERSVSKEVARIYPQGKKIRIVLPLAYIHRMELP